MNAPALRLTPLGLHISSLPLDARLAKMLLLAALCGCLDPLLSVAAALSAGGTSRGVFNAPRDKQEAASAAQREAFGSMRSDPLAIAAAYAGWERARAEGGAKAERAFCDAHYLNSKALREVQMGRAELARHLNAAGFLPPADKESGGGGGGAKSDRPSTLQTLASSSSGVPPCMVAAASIHSHNEPLLRGIICAAFYPNVCSATRTTATGGGRSSYEKLALACGDIQAWMHPSSINAKPARAESGLYVYTETVDSSRLFLRGTTRVPPAALLLFGATALELDIERVKQSGRVELGGGVRVRVSPQTCLLFKLLRKTLDGLLLQKAHKPESWPEREPAGCQVLQTVRQVIGQY